MARGDYGNPTPPPPEARRWGFWKTAFLIGGIGAAVYWFKPELFQRRLPPEPAPAPPPAPVPVPVPPAASPAT